MFLCGVAAITMLIVVILLVTVLEPVVRGLGTTERAAKTIDAYFVMPTYFFLDAVFMVGSYASFFAVVVVGMLRLGTFENGEVLVFESKAALCFGGLAIVTWMCSVAWGVALWNAFDPISAHGSESTLSS